ncbi:MAG: NADH:ubiquinone reductase (Na(+)-transporting) subunit F [Verrucomicrobiota bacterium]
MNRLDSVAASAQPPPHLDYSLTGENAAKAIERGLAEADWYQTPVPRGALRQLLARRNGPAMRDTLLWFGMLALAGGGTIALWGSWWAAIPYLAYAVLYATASDSRWHEASHGTAFRSDWMNNVLYEIASFMVMRESVIWRWSHTRHHSDTIIVGRDPEIQVSRPPDLRSHILSIFAIGVYRGYFPGLIRHALGRMTPGERTFVPETEFPKVFRNARIVLLVYLVTIAAAAGLQSWMPVFLVIAPHFFGTWLMIVHNTTQHAGLAENVLDHRLNCRTVYMNPVSRFIYWNMNYHVEHHMFPLVPYHALPRLHELIKEDCPPPYRGLIAAWSEILPTVLRQVKDPAYHVRRQLPDSRLHAADALCAADACPDTEGWLEICSAADLGPADVLRFDHGRKTYALIRDEDGLLYATDGICTHGNTHLGDGLVKGGQIECPKHNGRFNLADGAPARAPVCRGLATHPLEERGGRLWLNVAHPGGAGARIRTTIRLRVVSNRSVATFIKELVLEPEDASVKVNFTPGDYLQIDIPAYREIRFRDFDIPQPYSEVWERQHVFDLVASNLKPHRNNYSLASNQESERLLRFNVRIATPPPGQDCPPGTGSSYIFSLKPGDPVTAIGPFGDFHIKPTHREMIYIGGGAGMAPLRAHLSHLLETDRSARKVSYWYGARSRQEIFYEEFFQRLAREHSNFAFNLALSSPLPGDKWTGPTGFIHEVVLEKYLAAHPTPGSVEYYLCGPPMMIKACTKMLASLGVPEGRIAYDEF